MYKYQYYDVYAVIILLTALGIFEIIIGTYGHKSNRKKNDWLLEIVSSLQLFIIYLCNQFGGKGLLIKVQHC